MRVGLTYWGSPSCEGLLYSCCIGVVQESNLIFFNLMVLTHLTRMVGGNGANEEIGNKFVLSLRDTLT
jgi:hypothetical protein